MKFINKRAWMELGLLLINILVVTTLFKFFPKPVAAVVAGLCFVGVSVAIIWAEGKYGRHQRSWAWWTGILFLGAAAIPILFLRVFFWGKSFEAVGFWGITGPQLHQISTYLYLVLIIAVLMEGIRGKSQP